MKLWMSSGSPFARKARVLAREKGLKDRIEEVRATVSPVETIEELSRRNPLAKIPVLLSEDGDLLYDSSVICAYLDSLHDQPKAIPPSGRERFAALRLESLADGMLDAAVLSRYETGLRPQALRWDDWIEGQRRKILGGLAELEAHVAEWPAEPLIGQIAAACALGYLDYRFPSWDWRAEHPRLAKWFSGFSERASMRETMPS